MHVRISMDGRVGEFYFIQEPRGAWKCRNRAISGRGGPATHIHSGSKLIPDNNVWLF